MADPNITVLDDDIRYEDRRGCLVLVDPTRAEGHRDVATSWMQEDGSWRWRMTTRAPTGDPHPRALSRDQALRDMLSAYCAEQDDVAVRLDEQRPRFSFGEPQIFRA